MMHSCNLTNVNVKQNLFRVEVKMHNSAVRDLSETRQSQKQDNNTDPWEQTVIQFAANLQLKGHQIFTHPVYKIIVDNRH